MDDSALKSSETPPRCVPKHRPGGAVATATGRHSAERGLAKCFSAGSVKMQRQNHGRAGAVRRRHGARISSRARHSSSSGCISIRARRGRPPLIPIARPSSGAHRVPCMPSTR